MPMKFNVKTIHKSEAIGKTIDSIVDVYNQAAIRFTDGTYLVVDTDHEDASIYMGCSFRWSEWCRYALVELGICTGEEFDAKMREEHAASELKAAAAEHAEFERLRKKFDGKEATK